jgi:mRNA degradation ribonuclease J1/J2
MSISEKNVGVVDNFHAGTLAGDGMKLILLNGVVYKQREVTSHDGIVSVCLKRNKRSIKLLHLACVGIFEESEQDEIADTRNNIASEIKLSLEEIVKDKTDINKIKPLAEKLVRAVFIEARGNKPIVIVHVAD